MCTLGIDVSKNKIDLCLLTAGPGGKKKHKVLTNEPAVAHKVIDWLNAQRCVPESVTVVLEATGIYHENLAYGLHEAGVSVCMANPCRVREFAHGMDILNKNDAVDA
ncbi:IS110 family transposase, partial [Salmonella enterica subsp. enterica serovar Infantis]|nr:IS110 family transposase [Salmonella enterica subsp. enterica serovar Infantis]EJY8553815.1 transposase [Salmonella enterica subsp. enterica serovar Infantis]ELZ2887519.1 transposase [Salmonella enterica subsp. enterica serovar Infantis]